MTILHQCTFCKHFQGHKGTKPLCEAFPEGIPNAIFNNESDHRQPYPGDNGIRFEQSEYFEEHLGDINLSDMETRLLPYLQKLYELSPIEATNRAEELKALIQKRGFQFGRGALTPREYEDRIISALCEYDRRLGWLYIPDFSERVWYRYSTCSGCKAELHWDRHYAYSSVSSTNPDIVCCNLDMQNCLRCDSPVCEERLVTYQPNCHVCGREAGPGKRRRSVTINYDFVDTPLRWKCEECSEADKSSANEQ
jgi:hypothetical protein